MSAITSPWLVAADLFDPPPGVADTWNEDGLRFTRWMAHQPHPRQREFLACPEEDVLYGGAAGGGKSDALLLAALQWVDTPGYSAILFRRTFEDLNLPGALIPRSKEWLYPILGDRAWNEQRSRWTFPSGATLHFGYLRHGDDHFRYQGMEAQYIGVDEAAQIRPNQLRYLFSRLRKVSHGPLEMVPVRMRLASNPGGVAHEYLKARYIEQQIDEDDPQDTPERAARRIFVPARLEDNPSLDREGYRASLANLEPEVRAQLLDGDWDARQPGDWYFDERHLNAVAELGRTYEQQLQDDDLRPYGGIVHLGIDWGTSTHCVLGWPLDSGGFFIAREFHDCGDEVSRKTPRMLGLNEWDLPWGRAFFDAAGVTSQQTFNLTRDRLLRNGPAAKAIPFGAPAPRTAGSARKSLKGLGCSYLRRLARRAYGIHVLEGLEVPERTDGATFIPGPLPGHMAISPKCPELLRQLRAIERDPENPTDAWRKDDDQHGPDALVACVSTTSVQFRSGAAPHEKLVTH